MATAANVTLSSNLADLGPGMAIHMGVGTRLLLLFATFYHFSPTPGLLAWAANGGGIARPMSGVPHAVRVLYCWAALAYGLSFQTEYAELLAVSTVGVVPGLVNVIIFGYHAQDPVAKETVCMMIDILGLVTPWFGILEIAVGRDHAAWRLLSGSLCIVLAIGMYASPLLAMLKFTSLRKSIRGRSVALRFLVSNFDTVPLVAAIFHGAAWTMHGLLAGEAVDWFIAMPHLLGTGIAVLPLLLKLLPLERELELSLAWSSSSFT